MGPKLMSYKFLPVCQVYFLQFSQADDQNDFNKKNFVSLLRRGDIKLTSANDCKAIVPKPDFNSLGREFVRFAEKND